MKGVFRVYLLVGSSYELAEGSGTCAQSFGRDLWTKAVAAACYHKSPIGTMIL